jgi:putative endonuclease
MVSRHTQFGQEGESIAVGYLKKNGYKILEQNYRNKLGEIDIVAKDRDTIVFVEVKTRKSDQYVHPKWAVTPRKQRKISMVALYYLKENRQSNLKARFDVVTVLDRQEKPVVEIIKNAFELAYK